MSTTAPLRDREFAYGLWSTTAHPAVLDSAASAHPDFICLDTQHGVHLASLDTSAFTVIASYGVASLVRVEAVDAARIGRALDLGADGVVVPMIETVDDGRAAVAACRLSPRGSRSFGVQTRRVGATGQSGPVCWLQVETKEVMDHLDEIAALDGVDGLYIGPADLGLALVGEPAADVESVLDGSHPHSKTMRGAFEAVVGACDRAGIPAGIHCGTGRAAAAARTLGFRFSALASDLGLIRDGLTAQLESARA